MATTDQLNQRFGINGKATFFESKGGLMSVSINTKNANAEISLYGAQLVSFVPKGHKDIIWMSEQSFFEEGKAIRGGIPLCFPWFGPHPADKTKPQHGFARLQYWQVKEVKEINDETISVSLLLQPSEFSLGMWPYQFSASAEFIIGSSLQVKLTVTNSGTENFDYSDALHTYFNISSIDSVAIEGLQNAIYFDGFETNLKTQNPALLYFNTETNRRYVNAAVNCIIDDKGFNRKIVVEKTGSKVTVVWNPGEETTKTMKDIPAEGYQTFVCVEPANAYAGIDIITLAPGQSHTLSTTIKLGD
jgi:glucose-6-phosphate 1-epimerase